MIGLILTGHGCFASGLEQALLDITQEAPCFAAVDYRIGDSQEDLENKLRAAMEDLKECESILILSDLVGGAPYKTAVELGHPKGYEIIAGTNLGMLVEINLVRQFVSDMKALTSQALTVGKDQVQLFQTVEERCNNGELTMELCSNPDVIQN